jgi:hypothetical protein
MDPSLRRINLKAAINDLEQGRIDADLHSDNTHLWLFPS